jgi:hypothetical protein
MNNELYNLMASWIDSALSTPLPEGIAAFNFNLYDGGNPTAFELELMGAPTFTPDDEDWACDEIFMSPQPRFLLPHSTVGAHWESGLSATSKLLFKYINSNSSGALRLKQSKAVAVGFVDGNLQIIWAAMRIDT